MGDTQTGNRFQAWAEYSYKSRAHGGTGYYWQRSDGLRLSERESGPYYPVGVGPRLGRPPRVNYVSTSKDGYAPFDHSEHVLAAMQAVHEGQHVRFQVDGAMMAMIPKKEYPKVWWHPDGSDNLDVEQVIVWADQEWPLGTRREWVTMGIPAEMA